jgi:RNA polymerase sigma-70 factor (ECF subfamily)
MIKTGQSNRKSTESTLSLPSPICESQPVTSKSTAMKTTSYHPDTAFDSMHETYERLVKCVANRILHRYLYAVDDVCQQVWIEAHAQCMSGRTLGKNWFTLRTRSRALDVRRDLNEGPLSLDELVEMESGPEGEEDNALVDRLQFAHHLEGSDSAFDPRVREYVAAAVDRLTEPLRAVISAHYYAGRDLADIAVELHVPLGTVKRRLHDARVRLKAMFMPAEQNEAA